ncbi:MAG: CinA family protein [Treponema sp.]|jgi:PncC family amidohydrolase|nr:CinA family protein [Treponema sp.]
MMEKSQLAEELVKELSARSKTLAVAESCTGGLLADAVVRIPGASKVFWGGFVTYTADAKAVMLGVDTVDRFGAASRETAVDMAKKAIERSAAHVSVAITGLAGPDGDGTDTLVGTVWIATAYKGEAAAEVFHFSGSRSEIRESATCKALEKAIAVLK